MSAEALEIQLLHHLVPYQHPTHASPFSSASPNTSVNSPGPAGKDEPRTNPAFPAHEGSSEEAAALGQGEREARPEGDERVGGGSGGQRGQGDVKVEGGVPRDYGEKAMVLVSLALTKVSGIKNDTFWCDRPVPRRGFRGAGAGEDVLHGRHAPEQDEAAR